MPEKVAMLTSFDLDRQRQRPADLAIVVGRHRGVEVRCRVRTDRRGWHREVHRTTLAPWDCCLRRISSLSGEMSVRMSISFCGHGQDALLLRRRRSGRERISAWARR